MAKKSTNDSQAVEAYLATLPRPEREALERLRILVKETVPHVEERVSYGTMCAPPRVRDPMIIAFLKAFVIEANPSAAERPLP